MKKRMKLLALAAAMLLAGCAADGREAPAVGPETTAAVTEPAVESGGELAFGEIVWSVRRSADGGEAYLVRYAVVAVEGGLAAVVPAFTTDPDQLREALTLAAQMPLDGTGCLDLVPVDNCYTDPAQAQAAADAENGG